MGGPPPRGRVPPLGGGPPPFGTGSEEVAVARGTYLADSSEHDSNASFLICRRLSRDLRSCTQFRDAPHSRRLQRLQKLPGDRFPILVHITIIAHIFTSRICIAS